ncbi:hypothetical protein L3Q82_005096 [Scortum barcoo]|uniref:Uncharacterized protein n=1 Tax=Scortum barcoo TaxID=214431 RepID=A0ACB8VED7_9TELE|nr:hypothetical protein L3Q82_005096 [Scortum barcoo]
MCLLLPSPTVAEVEYKMAAVLRVILGEENVGLDLPNGIPSELEDLKAEIKRQHDLLGNFRLQFRDARFDNDFVNLSSTSLLKDRSTVKVNAEFTRITTKPLVSTFMFQLDHYTDPLLKAFRKKGGTAGLKITGIKAAMGKGFFRKAKSQSEAAVKASFILAEEIAKSARPFTEGDSIKNCMLKVCDEVCPDKRQLFLNISLSRNTIAERVDLLSINLKEQLVKKGKDFIAYSLAVDESTDISDIAQLSVFIRGVDSSLNVTEELLALRTMHGTTTGHDLYEEVSKCVNEMELPWENLVGLTTEGAPAMCGHKSGLVAKIREKMQKENVTRELTAYHCIIHQESLCGKALKMKHVMSTITCAVNFIRAKGLNHRHFKSFLSELEMEHGDLPYHTEVRWLSQGKVLHRCFELREEICLFLDSKGKDTTQLRDERFLCEMAFLCDITSHLNAMNLQLQGRTRVISDMYSTVKAFQTKLILWEAQMRKENLSHFPSCQTMKDKLSTSVFPSAEFADKISVLAADFRHRFADFEAQKSRTECWRTHGPQQETNKGFFFVGFLQSAMSPPALLQPIGPVGPLRHSRDVTQVILTSAPHFSALFPFTRRPSKQTLSTDPNQLSISLSQPACRRTNKLVEDTGPHVPSLLRKSNLLLFPLPPKKPAGRDHEQSESKTVH